jgi:hypothetical protein
MWRSPTGPGHRSFLSLIAAERAPSRYQAWARRRPHGCHSKYPFAFLVQFDEWVEFGAVPVLQVPLWAPRLTILPAAWAAGTTPCGEFVAPAGTPAPEMLVRFRYVSCTRACGA